MKKLSIKSFKAHDELTIDFDNKNFLLYGENGAGKSSIFEALKIIFFKDKLEQGISEVSAEDMDAAKIEFWATYNNKALSNDFVIEANDNLIDLLDYQVFMIQLDDTTFDKYLNVEVLLEKVFFMLPDDYLNRSQEIEETSNELLELFLENIKIKISIEDDYAVYISDERRNIFETKEIKTYFNEGKINLVVLSILLSVIKLFKSDSKKHILVLDDFITSLDMANRTFLMKYILDEFHDFQIFVFTHNVYFYNLIMYLVYQIFKVKEKWKLGNLYEINSKHVLYMKTEQVKLSEIKNDVKGQNPDFEVIGNKIRKKFERMLYELSKLIMIGGLDKSDAILQNIRNSTAVYFKMDGSKSSDDLINEIQEIITDRDGDLKDLIQDKISEYEVKDLHIIKETLVNLELYRKVSMHSLSHAEVGQNPVSINEIKQSIILMEQLERAIKDLVNKKVDGL